MISKTVYIILVKKKSSIIEGFKPWCSTGSVSDYILITESRSGCDLILKLDLKPIKTLGSDQNTGSAALFLTLQVWADLNHFLALTISFYILPLVSVTARIIIRRRRKGNVKSTANNLLSSNESLMYHGLYCTDLKKSKNIF